MNTPDLFSQTGRTGQTSRTCPTTIQTDSIAKSMPNVSEERAPSPLRSAGALHTPGRQSMNGKPVFTREAKTVINFESNFSHKLLCDGLTFSAGDACVYSCAFCYVPDLMRKLRAIPMMAHVKGKHEAIVVRRESADLVARRQLTDARGRPKFKDPKDRRVIYASPLVDVAGNLELVQETVQICRTILELTNWQIRLLSKSNLLPKIAEALEDWRPGRLPVCDTAECHSALRARDRVIYGVSTGTLDDGLAKAFEAGTPLVSKRLESLHWLQDNGFRTFGMICPSLPHPDYAQFAWAACAAIRASRCEHVWAEVMNVRGESFTRTIGALRAAGFSWEAEQLEENGRDRGRWEQYARDTFNAHAGILPKGKLRFLQYVTAENKGWWEERKERGAVCL
jgi:DNA repair photolyase